VVTRERGSLQVPCYFVTSLQISCNVPTIETPNPYRPGAAISPLFLAGRSQELRHFESTLRGSPHLPANVRLTGLRGVGKTVLLKEFERVAIDKMGWAAARTQLEPRHNTEQDLRALIVDLCEQTRLRISRAARLRQKVKGAATAARGLMRFSYEEFEISLAGMPGANERPMFQAIFETAQAADQAGMAGFLLMLDEAQVIRDDKDRTGEHPLSLLIAAINGLQEQEVPVGLILCGLPTLRANLLRARTYSERMFRGEDIGRLGHDEATEAFVRPLDDTPTHATEGLVERVIAEVEGYPFFIQLWGAELWEAARDAQVDELSELLLDQVEPDIFRRLDGDFHEGRVESLTPAEQDLLMATADCSYPPLRTSDIHGRSGKSEGNVNVLMGRLADQGVVYRVQKGQYEYTAPKFHDYLRRRKQRLADRGH